MLYTLTAKQGAMTSRFTFTESSDDRAMFEAIGEILDRAMNDSIWKFGEIQLRNEKGEIIHTMPAK